MPTSHLPANTPQKSSPSRIIIAANRGPAQFYERNDGTIVARQASGGLATALVSAARNQAISWIATASGPVERQAFAERPRRALRVNGVQVETRYVAIAADRTYRLFYDEVSNRILWFLQHYLVAYDSSPTFTPADHTAWDEGYVPVNRAIADAVIAEYQTLRETGEDPLILIQDYHLYLVPGMVRAALPEARISHFLHIPWPHARYWEYLPNDFTNAIMRSLACCDVVGFQTRADVASFMSCVETFLPRARRDVRATTFRLGRRTTRARDYPISIDPEHVQRLATSPAARRGFASLARYFDHSDPLYRVIIRVDRLEPTKNIVNGLRAFELMLEAMTAEERGRVRFVLLLVPSREGVTRYRRYARQVGKIADKINERYGGSDDPRVALILGNDQARALAAMRESDVMLVNSMRDGMHLGAKEMAVVNERDGVLILSRTTGVYQEMGAKACLAVTPTDIQETAAVLRRALELNPAVRHAIAKEARGRVLAHTVADWLNDQIGDLRDLDDAPAIPTITKREPAVIPVPPPVGETETDTTPGDLTLSR